MSRRFAIDAGRELAKRDLSDLFVHNDADQVDLHMSYSRGGSGWRWTRRRRSPPAATTNDVDESPASNANLLEVVLPYDSWCLRTARSESTRALGGLCPAEALDELLLVITELVLQSTVQTRDECTLLLHRTDDEILVVVRDRRARAAEPWFDVAEFKSGLTPSQSATTEYGSEGRRCLWARFNLPSLETA
jgi:hypothetical protein